VRRLRLLVDRRARLSSSGRVLAIRGTIRLVVPADLVVRVREWAREWHRALAVRCIRRGRFRREREVREDLALHRDQDLVVVRDGLRLGIGQELLRAG